MKDKVILHFDGDSFFASVEQVMNYRLKGKPVVTGGERGAITSASYEAKKLGVNRGITMQEAKRLFPGLVVLRGDYLSYSIFASRMYNIVREFTPLVDEYSIDECFADVTGLDKVYGMSYEELALKIKTKLEASLGVTYGVGMAPNKVLAKVASKHHKPAGFTVISQKNREDFLRELPVGKVWGIGPSSSIALAKLNIFNALDFANKSFAWIESHKLTKPFQEMWHELRGEYVKELNLVSDIPHSIIKSRTFSPHSNDRAVVFSQLSKNIEAGCIKARRHNVHAKEVYFYLKTSNFTYKGFELPLMNATSSPTDIIRVVKEYFDEVYQKGVTYRATGVSLRKFVQEDEIVEDLFGESMEVEKQKKIFEVVDSLAGKYGEQSVYLGSSMHALLNTRNVPHKTIDLPFLGKVK
jgi:DNA polymerase-4/DNA polymerase V